MVQPVAFQQLVTQKISFQFEFVAFAPQNSFSECLWQFPKRRSCLDHLYKRSSMLRFCYTRGKRCRLCFKRCWCNAYTLKQRITEIVSLLKTWYAWFSLLERSRALRSLWEHSLFPKEKAEEQSCCVEYKKRQVIRICIPVYYWLALWSFHLTYQQMLKFLSRN